jgi:hypothetical protein
VTFEPESPFAVFARYQKAPPVDVYAIARDLGLNVYKQPLGSEIIGMLVRDPLKGGASGFAIYVSSTTHPNRQRSTIAHEIGHFVLHKDLMDTNIVDDTMYRSELGSTFETQANKMAADILMPIRLVKEYYKMHQDAGTLARLFEVSKAAMEIRLKGIGTLL